MFCAPALGQESFGIVLLEAMAAGTAVLASDIPGYANVARRDQEALLVAPGDPEALRAGLRRLLDADALRADLVEAGERRVSEFSLTRLAERYIPVYETAIAVGTLSVMNPHELAVEVATRVHEAVAPHLGTFEAREKVGDAPGGDATLAIDEVAETVVREVLESAGDIAFYSEDQGLVRYGEPRAILVIDPVDGTRPAAAGLESCCVSVAVVPANEHATLGDVSFGVIYELKTGQRFVAERGAGASAMEADGTPIPVSLSANTDLDALFWTAGLRGRPSLPMTVVLEELVDRSGMRGGYFDLGSATFNITRIVTGQLDAYVDVGPARSSTSSPRPSPRSSRSATATSARTSPTTSPPPP